MNKKTIKVYDTITGKMVDVEVSEKVYKAYTRTEWNIKNNDNSFFEHEIQFSQLIGGDNGSFENFREFIIDEDAAANKAIIMAEIEAMFKAVKRLDEKDKALIKMLFFDSMTERECAVYYSINQKNINKKKKRILAKLYKLINS
ncbi:sigma-70 family RNA polymerase sigma factor [Ruminococcus sp.]|uniref:sigma-70 family RNA polymerase sigma factor n=1 Tax=Ruminococcus sp. TaxID=41978 RepID=UPI0025875E43|nr:sigma-70 family RNA polymerase sigma factor [Ruminococcus sp.]MCR5021178.1 sigma-70 family RNA polymerase sigma factor [Ruminococcus sp.]